MAADTLQVADRLFVPLATDPFRWFASGRKRWELRRLGRQYTPKHLRIGRRVELRRGYAVGESLWGTIDKVSEASSIREFFDIVPFDHVIPTAASLGEAVATAEGILGVADVPVIGFLVAVDR